MNATKYIAYICIGMGLALLCKSIGFTVLPTLFFACALGIILVLIVEGKL